MIEPDQDRTPQNIPTFSSLEAHEASAFRHYVENKNDLEGMIAYGLYKLQKSAFIEENPSLDEKQIALASRQYFTGRCYARNMRKAKEKLARREILALAQFQKKKTHRDLWIGVLAGIIAAALTPLIFSGLLYVLTLSGEPQALTLASAQHAPLAFYEGKTGPKTP